MKIKKAKPEEVEKTIKKSEGQKKLELTNELNNVRKELKRNTQLLNGFEDETGRTILSCDESVKQIDLMIELKQIELAKDAMPLGNIRYAYEGDQRRRQLIREIYRKPELEALKKKKEKILKQKEEMIKKEPELKTRIKEIEKKLK